MSATANTANSRATARRTRAWFYTQHQDHLIGSPPPPLALPVALPTGAQYLTCQLEVCPETSRTHIQGFVYFGTVKSLAQVVRLLGGAHVEVCRNIAKSIEYCQKEDTRLPDTTFVEFGTRPQQGRRSDLAAFAEAVKSGARKRRLVDEYPSVIARYPRFYADLNALVVPERTPPQVWLLVGPTCTGKSTKARSFATEAGQDLWVKPKSKTSWFDGYDGQPWVLLDDFKGQLPLLLLLELLDRWSVRVEVKGSFTWFYPQHIVITSNYHPTEWYDYSSRQESRIALYRRIHRVLEYSALDVFIDHDTTYQPGCDPRSLPYFDY